MGVCLPKESNQFIRSIYDKQSITKGELSRFSTNFTAIKSLKSIKNLTNIDNRISKYTKYDDINKYYTLSKEIISKGGSGIVYGGNNIYSKNKSYEYAIKQVIKKNDQLNISLIKEIEINSIIHHNNIVQCFDIFEDDISIYFVFEMMPNGDLFDYILKKSNHILKDNEIINILEQILLTLIYLHEKLKVIHRDIKPENFMIKKDQSRMIVKLMDFGTSDFIKSEGFNYIAQGTPLYIAPEVYLEQTYDEKIDIWATGVVLYNMATGIHPFKNNDDYLKDKLNKSFNLDFSERDEEKIIKDNVINKKLDFNVFKNYGLRILAQHLLDRDPKERYSAMEAFNELNKIKTGACLNKKISRTINESPMKIIKKQKIHETPSNKNIKYSAKSSFGKFKGIFKDINNELNDDNKNEEDKKSGDSEKEKKDKDKNKKKDNNEIRIFIKKKNRKNK